MNTLFTIRLYRDPDSAATECGPDQVVAELYDGWFMNVPPGASAATGYPIRRILGKPIVRIVSTPKKASTQGTTAGRTLRRAIGDTKREKQMTSCPLKRREAPIYPKDGRAALIKGFTFHNPAPPPAPDYLIERLIPKECEIVFIGGQSGAGKTFILVDLAVCLATGAPFFGKKIDTKVATIILAAESPGSLKYRLHVAAERAAPGESLPICHLGTVPDLKDQKEVAALIQRINAASDELEETYGIPLGLVIIDTMAAAFTFDDENDNSEASSMIKVMKDIGKATGAIVVPVHHYGKASTGGLRGASAFHGGTDVVLSVLAEIDRTEGTVSDRRLSLTKSREDEMGPIAPFDLHYVEIGTHKDGESYGSCYVEPLLDRAGEANNAKTKKESASLTAFRKSFTETKLTPICASATMGCKARRPRSVTLRRNFSGTGRPAKAIPRKGRMPQGTPSSADSRKP
jgi:hypothetical protein